jgi:poly(A) polymerase
VPEPVVIPRERHPISRRDIDPDALRVLHRLQQSDHVAYLVGGSVRDLILGRRPKDFDIGTDAHPHQIKKLFRNCWIIGRRFRLAHIKFGLKTIEVATFRKNVADLPADSSDATLAEAPPGAEADATLAATAAPEGTEVFVDEDPDPVVEPQRDTFVPDPYHSRGGGELDGPPRISRRSDRHAEAAKAGIVHRDNTFGTTEEDAFRRDFTVNALFYDVATRSIIDYVGGLADLEKRVIRSIGDPKVRFVEDPVRMLRAAVLSARLDFELDDLVLEAIAEQRHLILKASPARLLEEYFKILRSGAAESSFRALGRLRLLELMTPELKSPPKALWDSLARLDRYRAQFPSAPPELTTTILIGALLQPIGALNRPMPDRGAGDDVHPERVSFGALPVARKDLDRLRQLLQTIPRLLDPALPPRVVRGLPHRPSFGDAITWLEVFGDDPAALESWKAIRAALPPRPPQPHGHHRGPQHGHAAAGPHAHAPHPPGAPGADGHAPRRKRRRRRRRGRGGNGPAPPAAT